MLNAEDDVVTSVHAQEHQVPSTRPVPETVREAITFMKLVTIPSQNMIVEDILSSHVRLVGACHITHTTWANTLVAFEDDIGTMDYKPQSIS
jgi:hypothetical protein